MSDPDPPLKPPRVRGLSRHFLWLQLLGGVVAEAAIVYLILTHGIPGGLVVAELMAVPMFLLVLFVGRAVGRLREGGEN